jgi:regulator of replication initiation timing
MKRMDAVRLDVIARRFDLGIVTCSNEFLYQAMTALIAEVRASHREIQDLKTENERLREQLAAEGQEDCLLSREASDRALKLTGCMEDEQG